VALLHSAGIEGALLVGVGATGVPSTFPTVLSSRFCPKASPDPSANLLVDRALQNMPPSQCRT
jgi:hypothetical protein